MSKSTKTVIPAKAGIQKGNSVVPQLRFPEFRDAREWEVCNLGDISTVVRGGSPRPIDGFITKESSGLNWLKIGDVDKEAKYVTRTQDKVIAEALSKTREVHPGDLILSNSMSFGRPYLMKIKSCIHDVWIAITEIRDSVEREYLYYFIFSSASQAYFLDNAAGSGVLNLNADIIKNLSTSYPTGAEQQKIADCLSSLDTLIAAQAEKIDALKTHKKGLMQQLFPQNGETIPRLRFPQFRDAGEWEENILRSICERIMDGTHFSPKSKSGPRPYLTSKNIREGRLDLSNLSYISEDDHREIYARCPVKKLDVLLTKDGANTGNCTINTLEDEFSLLSSVAVLRGDASLILQEFLYQSIASERMQTMIVSSMSGQAITRITLEKLGNYAIPLPSIAEQERVADCLSSLDALIAAQAEKLDTLKAHKKGLVQQLFPTVEAIGA